MGRHRHHENPYARLGFGPKLMLTGRLHGTFGGRPVEIEADGRELLLRVSNLRSAWMLRRNVSDNTIPLLRAFRDNGFRLRLRICASLALDVLPQPHAAVGLLFPLLRFAKSGVSH